MRRLAQCFETHRDVAGVQDRPLPAADAGRWCWLELKRDRPLRFREAT